MGEHRVGGVHPDQVQGFTALLHGQARLGSSPPDKARAGDRVAFRKRLPFKGPVKHLCRSEAGFPDHVDRVRGIHGHVIVIGRDSQADVLEVGPRSRTDHEPCNKKSNRRKNPAYPVHC